MMKIIKIIIFLLFFGTNLLAFAEQKFNICADEDMCLYKQGFSLGYSHRYRQAVWVAYILTADHLQRVQVRRRDKFKADPAVQKRPVRPKDYAHSGYDKGHLAPAADMTYSFFSMTDSFFMTNISPQTPGCNRGIWKRLETQIRYWAIKEEKLYIITGPIFSNRPYRMKKSRIPIPIAFYKIIFDLTPPMKMIGFIVPNETSKRRIASFAVSVDEVERITGYDFFSDLDDEFENHLEKQNNFSAWEH